MRLFWVFTKVFRIKKTPDGQVVTEAYFNLEQQAGIEGNHLINSQAFRVLIPGGKWQGMVYFVSGSPSFEKGEKVALILKKNKFGYTVANLSMSKFKVIGKGRRKILKSAIFSDRPNIGTVSWHKFQDMVESSFAGGLKNIDHKKVVIKKEVKEALRSRILGRRMPASINEKNERNEEQANSSKTVWIVLIMGLLGGLFSRRIKVDKHEK